MDFAYKLREHIKRDIFTLQDIKTIFNSITDPAIHSGITRSLETREFLKLKRGLYLFAKNLQRGSISKLVVANKLYDPSYISFESALSYHGLIPEAVYTTTSACFQRKNKTFSNDLGNFSFDYISSRPFFMGVQSHKEEGGVLMAAPLKALFDLIYIRRKNYNSILDIENDFRIEPSSLLQEISKISILELEILAKSYKKKNIYLLYEILIKAFK